jgi:hypothetical protein
MRWISTSSMPSLRAALAMIGAISALPWQSSRRALRAARRGVGQHGEHAPPHRHRLITQRDVIAGRPRVADDVVRAVVDDDQAVERGDAAVLAEADFHA